MQVAAGTALVRDAKEEFVSAKLLEYVEGFWALQI